MKKFIILLILVLSLIGCSHDAEQVWTEQFPYPESTEILYKETIEKGKLYYTKMNQDLDMHLLLEESLKIGQTAETRN